MIARFYHTGYRAYIEADVYDAGAKEPIESVDSDALLQFERLPGDPPVQIRKAPGKNQRILLEACREEPGTATELAIRTGMRPTNARDALKTQHFKPVGIKIIAGRKRVVWGPAE